MQWHRSIWCLMLSTWFCTTVQWLVVQRIDQILPIHHHYVNSTLSTSPFIQTLNFPFLALLTNKKNLTRVLKSLLVSKFFSQLRAACCRNRPTSYQQLQCSYYTYIEFKWCSQNDVGFLLLKYLDSYFFNNKKIFIDSLCA